MLSCKNNAVSGYTLDIYNYQLDVSQERAEHIFRYWILIVRTGVHAVKLFYLWSVLIRVDSGNN